MRGSRKFCQRGPTLTGFLVDEWREDPSTTISSPPAQGHIMAFGWLADDGPAMNAGLVAL